MPEKLNALPQVSNGFIFSDDFLGGALADSWTLTGDNAPALTAGVQGGACTLDPGSTANDQSNMLLTSKPIVPAAGLVVEAGFRFKLTEQTAGNAGVMIGLCSSGALDVIPDGAASIAATTEFAGIYKLTTDTTWRVGLQRASVGLTAKTSTGTAGGAVWEQVRLQLRMPTLAEATLTAEHSRGDTAVALLRESGVSGRDPGISITRSMASAAAVGLMIGFKAVEGHTNYTIVIDYAWLSCSR